MTDRHGGCDCVNTFTAKSADDDLRAYLSNGPGATTKALLAAILAEGVEGATLLDIGGGIGSIQLELLGAGLAHSTSIDASEAYVAAARAEAERRGFGERTRHHAGVVGTLAADIEPADIVTLDKVVCCDPDLGSLLGVVSSRAGRMIGLVYPRVTWWNRLASRAFAAFGVVTRDQKRWHLHRDARINAPLQAAGFERREVTRTLVWQVVLFVRPAAGAEPV